MRFLIRSFLVWLLFIPLAAVNGALRDGMLIPALGDAQGHVISTLTLSVLILALALIAVDRLGVHTATGYAVVGAFWVVLTIIFELSFFVLAMIHPLDMLLKGYDLFRGRLWMLMLLVMAFAPLFAATVRKRIRP